MHLVSFGRRRGGAVEGTAAHSMRDAGLGFEAFEDTLPGARRLGALLRSGPHAGAVIDLNRTLAIKLAGEDAGAPEAEADSLLPGDMREFLAEGPRALRAAQAAVEFAHDALTRFDGPDLWRAGAVEPRRAVAFSAPVPRPGKIVAVARNYADHAAERRGEPPPEPSLFLKAASAVIGPGDVIELPAASQCVDYEGELAAVIGSRARNLDPASALEAVAGYCAANDVTARDFQHVRGQHFIGKSCDTFAPLGPVLVTRDEIPDPQDLGIRTLVSGEELQNGRTKEMIFPVATIVAFASRLMTLEPGDVVLTGTPAGVGAARVPPRWLRDGDVVEVDVERIGTLCNYVRASRGA